jgi:SAM-dependent methyltransferase
LAKTPGDVGRDFDEYARRWQSAGYQMEKSWDGSEMTRSDAAVRFPGDEWGEITDLIRLYEPLFERLLPGSGSIDVLEIGAGGGRSTQAVIEVLGERIGEYHVVDVSEVFVSVLRERIDRPVEIHVIADVRLDGLPTNKFQLCLAQSSWSHISLYDQYLYLRDLRRVLAYDTPFVVNGQFMLGVSNDWTWDRFRRRVYQLEHHMEGVYHEFTGVGVLVEALRRLEWNIEVVHGSGFVARRGQANPAAFVQNLPGPLSFPYLPTLHEYAEGVEPLEMSLP